MTTSVPQTQRQMAREAGWNQAQVAVNFANATRAEAERIADIAAHFNFERHEVGCYFDGTGVPVELSMLLTEKQTGRAYTVTVRQNEGHWEWLVNNTAAPFCAGDLIGAVRQRIGAKLAGQLTGPVTIH